MTTAAISSHSVCSNGLKQTLLIFFFIVCIFLLDTKRRFAWRETTNQGKHVQHNYFYKHKASTDTWWSRTISRLICCTQDLRQGCLWFTIRLFRLWEISWQETCFLITSVHTDYETNSSKLQGEQGKSESSFWQKNIQTSYMRHFLWISRNFTDHWSSTGET